MIRFFPILGTSVICAPHQAASSLSVHVMLGKLPALRKIGNEVVRSMEPSPSPDGPEPGMKNEKSLKMPTPALAPRPPAPF